MTTTGTTVERPIAIEREHLDTAIEFGPMCRSTLSSLVREADGASIDMEAQLWAVYERYCGHGGALDYNSWCAQ
jgi:hypothetical protein